MMKAPPPLFADEQPMSTQTETNRLDDQVEGEAQYDRKQSLPRESFLDQSTLSLPHIPAPFGVSHDTSINAPQIVETLSQSISKDTSNDSPSLAYCDSPDILHYLAYEAVLGCLQDDEVSHQQRCPLPVTKNAFTWRIYETLSEYLKDHIGYDHEWARPFLVKGQSYFIRVYHFGCFVESPPADLLQRRLVASQLYDELDSARCELDFSGLDQDIFDPYFNKATLPWSQGVDSSDQASASIGGITNVAGIITDRAFVGDASTTPPLKGCWAQSDEIKCRPGLRPNLDEYKNCLKDLLMMKRDEENLAQHDQNDNITNI